MLLSQLADSGQNLLKGLVVGLSGTGKTGLLASLLKCGYRVAIVCTDGKVGPLVSVLRAEDPGALERCAVAMIDQPLQLNPYTGELQPQDGLAAFGWAQSLCEWFRTPALDWGPVSGWRDDTVLVVDSATPLADAAMDSVRWANNRGGRPDAHGRDFGAAQDRLNRFFARLQSPVQTPCHVLVMCHPLLVDTPEGGQKFLPGFVGKALSPKAPARFDMVLETRSMPGVERTDGKPWSRRIVMLEPTMAMDLKLPAATLLPPVLPVETALAHIFAVSLGRPGPLPAADAERVYGQMQAFEAGLPNLAAEAKKQRQYAEMLAAGRSGGQSRQWGPQGAA